MDNKLFMPPIRLILNSQCNGKCMFCHNEGNERHEEMPQHIIEECIKAAEELPISKIALTGGEPTLRNDLPDIINRIKEHGKILVSLTTNGYNLKNIIHSLIEPIDNINLSIISLKNEVAMKYQNVDPSMVLEVLCSVPARNRNLNIVVIEDNYLEIDKFIEWGIKTSTSVDLMFLDRKDEEYKSIQKNIINRLINAKGGEILLNATPVLKIDMGNGCILRIKTPFLSGLLYNGICESCGDNNECFEKICAIRVHPNGLVTPCLKQKICLEGENTFEKIKNTYYFLQDMTIANDFVV